MQVVFFGLFFIRFFFLVFIDWFVYITQIAFFKTKHGNTKPNTTLKSSNQWKSNRQNSGNSWNLRSKEKDQGRLVEFAIDPHNLIIAFLCTKKSAEAANVIVEEGKQAIDGNEQHPVFDTSPESFVLGNLVSPTFNNME